jgi:hypothetical protein
VLKLFKHVSIICSHHDQGDLGKKDNVVQYTGFADVVGRMGKCRMVLSNRKDPWTVI